MKLKYIISSVLLTLIISSCTTIKTVKSIYATEAHYQDYSNGEKNIRFVPMAHISTKEFYKDVVRVITESKKNDFVLFYEFVDIGKASDEEQRKIRKLVGFIPSPEGYEKMLDKLSDERLVAQDNDQFLGLVNQKDFNADVAPQDVVNTYEKMYGSLVLTETDLNTPLTETIKDIEPKKQTMRVLLDFRNEYLANEIDKSKYKNIIVLYGAKHEKGLLKDLKKLDGDWKKVK